MAYPVCVGVLALQGSYREHMTCLTKTGVQDVVEVDPKAEPAGGGRWADYPWRGEYDDGFSCSSLGPGRCENRVIFEHFAPSVSSIDALREFAASGKPIWGTCAGLIFLAEEGEGGFI
eukprot:1176515-Prorocentrum_minimum.AAC.3